MVFCMAVIPTLLLVLMATLFNTLAFEMERVQRFQNLKNSPPARTTILSGSQGRLLVLSLYDDIRSQNLALIPTGLLVLLAPLLRIAASRLYTTNDTIKECKARYS